MNCTTARNLLSDRKKFRPGAVPTACMKCREVFLAKRPSISQHICMSKATKQTKGVVYFVHAPSAKRLKIGFTCNLELRMRGLMTDCPVEHKLLNYVQGTMQLEQTILYIFERYRRRGEWFEDHPDLLEFISRFERGTWLDAAMLVQK